MLYKSVFLTNELIVFVIHMNNLYVGTYDASTFTSLMFSSKFLKLSKYRFYFQIEIITKLFSTACGQQACPS